MASIDWKACGAGIDRMTLLLSNEDVEAALSMADCLEAMEIAYRDLGLMQGANGVRSEVLTPTVRDDALYALLTMSGVVPRFGIGAVRINSDILTWPISSAGLRRVKVPAAPNNRYVGLVLLFSTHSGEPLAVYPDGVVQRMRAGATCGLAAKYLARAEARCVALLGTGWQAGAQIMAICAVRNIERVRCYSPRRERREAFAQDMRARLGIEVVPVAGAREAVSGADIVMCATNSMEPVFAPEWLEPGMHVSSLKRLELDASVAAAADVVFVHVRDAEAKVIRTAGADLARETEQQKAVLSNKIEQSIRPELSDLLLGRAPGRKSDRETTLFLNYTGLGYQFAATGQVIYTKARERGLGRELDTDALTSALPS
jgi:ornithine cyclodeaminase/alanine dehydrogenase-like protein (mu-crystallin family)